MNLSTVFTKALQAQALNKDEALLLYNKVSTPQLMGLAQQIRFQKHPKRAVSWQIDRNINISNVCISGCLFCNFHCKKKDTDKIFETSLAEYKQKIEELHALGGHQILLQGGLHPDWGIEYYETLFRSLKSYDPELRLHALGPPEVAHIARISSLDYRTVLERLVAVGLSSLPGAGAEILCDRVRKILSPGKPNTQAWLGVMREAHKMGLLTSATMVFGHIETPEERIDHLLAIRQVQSEKPENTPGFLSFTCWPMQIQGTMLAQRFSIEPCTPVEYIRMLALSRIVLHNISNIQASWLTVGVPTAQLCLHAGANDMGSIMVEENVVSSAGSHHQLNAQQMQDAICAAGFSPWLRDQGYHELRVP